jgi:hypothetical protein
MKFIIENWALISALLWALLNTYFARNPKIKGNELFEVVMNLLKPKK